MPQKNYMYKLKPVVVVDGTTLKSGRKPVKLQKESPAGYAEEGKQSKGFIGENKWTVFCIFWLE